MAGLILLIIVLLISARTIAGFVIEIAWWKELGQFTTFVSMMIYRVSPIITGTLLAFLALFVSHAFALRFASVGRVRNKLYYRIVIPALLVVGGFVASSSVDTWTVVRFFGGQALPADATGWQDSVFGLPLSFYLFDLPFLNILRGYLLALTIAAAFVFWLTARGWQLRDKLPEIQQSQELDPRIFRLEGGLESKFLRGAAVVFLIGVAIRFFLGRYELLFQDHGFMVGVDYVAENITIPLQWLVILSCLVSAVFVWMGRWLWAASLIVVLALHSIVPKIVEVAYVRPNEITLQRQYIERHIAATRAAYHLDRRTQEIEFDAQPEANIDVSEHGPLFDNIRLWDWRAFHDTTTQIQALRTYYVFNDSDVDRYQIDGQLRQVMLSPRELDIRQLPDAQASWVNSHILYTHGYGMVMAEANRITPEGLPVLFVKDAPPVVETESLQLTRPELYYGEINHEPVFVGTTEDEFSYPSGSANVFSRYEGSGGLSISSFPMRVAAAIAYGDVNMVLTRYFTEESRMMIRRNVRQRLESLAGFVTWDPDPYLVLTDEGGLVWTVDGYTTSAAHPYSQVLSLQGVGRMNYIRNSVKATVDAYSGEVRIYVFEETDPVIQSYQQLFPDLLIPASEMPDDLRRHARYPILLFRVQAEMYRTYHMTDPQAFYNKEDVWDIARNIQGQQSTPQPVDPTYVVATVPGGEEAEFLLMQPFVPRNKDNLVGLMMARCDGEHLGEILFLQLSKQELFYGTMQIEARVNQDQNISKDLSLWNQQGSQVLRGQMLVLPVEDTLIYVEPIYIQAAEARMPQLKKVVLAMGNRLIYRDTYDEALAELSGLSGFAPIPTEQVATGRGEDPPAVETGSSELRRVRELLRRYRQLASQGRWSEAGQELEEIERLVQE